MGHPVDYGGNEGPTFTLVLVNGVVTDAVRPPREYWKDAAVGKLLHVDVDPGAPDGRARNVPHDLAEMLDRDHIYNSAFLDAFLLRDKVIL